MWQHITGVEQPAKKIKLDNNEKLERKRTYDQVKRKRTQRPSQRPYSFRQDDGDAGDDDVSSDDNTDILSSI